MRKVARKSRSASKTRTASKARRTKASSRARPIPTESKIKIVGDHNRREGSRWFKNYGIMARSKTVADYLKKGGDRDSLQGAVKEGYIKVA